MAHVTGNVTPRSRGNNQVRIMTAYGTFLSASGGDGVTQVATDDATDVKQWWLVTQAVTRGLSTKRVVIKAVSTGKNLRAHHIPRRVDLRKPALVDQTSMNEWACVNFSDGSCAFQSHNGYWLSAGVDGRLKLVTACNTGERFFVLRD
jgi:hypothetical protein